MFSLIVWLFIKTTVQVLTSEACTSSLSENRISDSGSVIVELSALCKLLKDSVVCASCGVADIQIIEEIEGRKGLA